MVDLPVLRSGNTYVRTFDARIDVVDGATLRVEGRLQDDRIGLAHRWLLRTPAYEVVEADASRLAGEAGDADPALCSRYSAIAGVVIGPGFSRRIRDALGTDRPGVDAHLLLAIEMARVGQQVYQFPADFEGRFPVDPGMRSGPALVSWQKDRAYMRSLADSCFTYRDDSAALFASRDVASNVGPELTRPAPGTRAFWRRKRIALTKANGGFTCESAMEDSLHDIAVRFRIDADGCIRDASSSAARVPYRGLCEEPHRLIAGLDGLRLDEGVLARCARQVGGAQGCTHLFDLAADCLRLFVV
jgi:DUF2889 family protein